MFQGSKNGLILGTKASIRPGGVSTSGSFSGRSETSYLVSPISVQRRSSSRAITAP
jgi:hypothetical protein